MKFSKYFHFAFSSAWKIFIIQKYKKKTINTTNQPKGTSSNITFIYYDQCVVQHISIT
jgi:hypothetical protein